MPIIAGVDEVGRGPLAGPVVAAAVILHDTSLYKQLKDSKKCTEKARDRMYDLIDAHGSWAIGQASVEEIDEINILQASLLAMKRAVMGLKTNLDEVWVDGPYAPKIPFESTCFIKGDERVPLISAASIIAKVTRDRQMLALGEQYPGFGFEQHKGYGTKAHLQAIEKMGVTPIHRRTFKPVKLIIQSSCQQI